MTTNSAIKFGTGLIYGSWYTTMSDTGISLTDGQNFTITEASPYVLKGCGFKFSANPSTASGQVTVELFSDSSRSEKVYEHVMDLSDTSTLEDYDTFGFDLDTAGTLYGTLACSGVAGGETVDLTLMVMGTQPTGSPAALSTPYGDGIEDDGTGKPRVALHSNSGLEFSSGDLKIDGDITQPAYISTNAAGAYVTGAVDTTSDQTIAGEKRFNEKGLIPRVAAGAPSSGSWSQGTEVLDSDDVKWRCITGGTPGTWELADTVTMDPDVEVSGEVDPEGDSEVLTLDVLGNVGFCLWLRVWARRYSGTGEMQVPYRVRVYQTDSALGREVVWQGLGLARQTYLTVSLPASQTYLEVNDNNIADVEEFLCVYEDDDRYELGRCSSRESGYLWLDEALVDSSSWAINTLVIPVSEWFGVPWLTTDGSNPQKIIVEVRNDGASTDPSLVFYVQAKAMNLGVIR